MRGFSTHQLKKLTRKLDPARVQSRERDGRRLEYVEGWFAISEANAIFGYAGWDRSLVHFERVFEMRGKEETTCAYTARVRITVCAHDGVVVREGTGFGQAQARMRADAHERAIKAAETDATKRALVTFGNRFGLSLYDKDAKTPSALAGARSEPREAPPATVQANTQPDGASNEGTADLSGVSPTNMSGYRLVRWDGTFCDVRSAEAFCSGLRQLINATQDADEINSLRANNGEGLTALRSLQNLKTAHGEHYADVLERLMTNRDRDLQTSAEQSLAPVPQQNEQSPQREVISNLPPDAPSGTPSTRSSAIPPYPIARALEYLARPLAERQDSSAITPENHNPSHAAPEIAFSPAPKSIPQTTPTRRSRISGGLSVDKSVFALPTERRLRSKAHLMFVASNPCLLCEGLPCHAHHITFAQPRGLSIKVSDEFTVPLCAVHHNELHASGNEASWWRGHGIDPLVRAQAFWRESMIGIEPQPNLDPAGTA